MKLIEILNNQRLFSKLFVVMTASIITVCVLTSLITIRMSERLFVETFSITNGKLLRQINTGLASFHDSIVNTVIEAGQSGELKTYLTGDDQDSITMAKVYYHMMEKMNNLTSNLSAYDVALTVIGINGRSYSTDDSYWPVEQERLANDLLTNQTKMNQGRLVYQYDTRTGADGLQERYIVASKALVEPTNSRTFGMIYIAIREEVFRQFYTNFTSTGNDVVVLNASGEVVSSNQTALLGHRLPEVIEEVQNIEAEQLDYKNGMVQGDERIILSQYLLPYDFYLVNLIDREQTVGQIIDVRSIAFICISIIVVALLIVFVITKRLTRSLTRLVRQMSTITHKDFGNYIRVKGSYEVKELAKAFNYMLDEVNDYIRKLIDTQKEQRNAELAALQRQINPHFLYNTLASIKMLVMRGSKETAGETINALISLLQNTISNVSETITIEQELDNLRNYVLINHVRYGDRIKVRYFVAPGSTHCEVPKLIIQPFIENAFFHAFHTKSEGTVSIMIFKQEGTLVCEVVDNGDGMELAHESDPLPNSRSKRQLFTGIGIRNVDERIKLLYGEPYGINIESKIGEGTKIRIVLPIIQREDEAKSE